MANENVGHIKCPFTNKLAVVRKDKRGKFYYFSDAGKITPNLPNGQAYINQNMTQWAEPGKPPEGVKLSTLMHGAPPQVDLVQVEKPVNEPKQENEPKKEGGFLEWLNN